MIHVSDKFERKKKEVGERERQEVRERSDREMKKRHWNG